MLTDEYLKLAEVEDSMWYFRALQAHIRRALRGMAAPALRVLDAGCGTGGTILKLRAEHPGWNFSGVDNSPLAIELARRRCGAGVELQEASITALPHGAESFDVVLSMDVVNHVDDRRAALAEFHRVLRPGGVVAVNVAAYKWMWSYHDVACETKHRYVRPELAAELAEAGFVGARLTHWNLLAFPLIFIKRKLLPDPGATSDVRKYPATIEAGFSALAAIEGAWLNRGLDLPAGNSIFAWARKGPALRIVEG